jgi:hypothetical protein
MGTDSNLLFFFSLATREIQARMYVGIQTGRAS